MGEFAQRIGVGMLLISALMVGACQSARPLPTGMYHAHKEFQTFKHNKAWVASIGVNGSWSYGWTREQVGTDAAIRIAKERCEKGRREVHILAECRLHYLGNMNVSSLPDHQLEQAIAYYKKAANKNATIDDFKKDLGLE